MNESTFRAVAIDPQAIARHLELMFGYLEGYVPLRLLSELGTPIKPAHNTFHQTDDDGFVRAVQQAAARAHLEGRAVYVVPGVVASPGSAKAKDVVASGVLLVDLDEGDTAARRDHLIRHLGPASLIVASGGRTDEGHEKQHVYWRLSEAATGEDLKTLTTLRARVARAVGGDTSFDSIHQPIRVAGTIHGKNGVKTLVRILDDTALEYELSDLAERVLEMPVDPDLAGGASPDGGAKHADNAWFSAADAMKRRFRDGGKDGRTRYQVLSSVIGHWLRLARYRRVSLDEAWRAVADFNLARIEPPWEADRLHREFLALLRVDERRNGPMPTDDVPPQGSAVAPPLSEDGLAAAFVERQRGDWRHVAAWAAWLRWSGSHWIRDDMLSVREAVRQVCRSAIAPETSVSEAKRVASEKTIRAVERIAAADPAIAARVSDWDGDPFLLNTPGGIIHLDTGELIAHDPARMLTQMTTASLGSACPQWRSFLEEITGYDAVLAAYLARLSGYCLSGSTEEQVFAFLYGTGANGKSVFLQTVSSLLGTYAATAPLGAFMSSRNDAHPTDLAGLVGKRLVTVAETEPGRSWAETRIKTITGGDPIRARFMHRDFFEFTPSFKLVIAGNHRPRLSGVGEAMRRRLHLVPFGVTIPPERRDRRLIERLLAERDGILGWMLEGYADWREIGLSPPARVVQAAEDYFDEEDLVGQWIAECCACGPEHRATSRHLFQSWSGWAHDAGTEADSQKTLGDALRERGFRSGKVAGQRGWLGIGLRRRAEDYGGAA